MSITVPPLPFLTFDLEVALQAVADRSFYEDLTISPLLSVVDASRTGDASSVVGYWVTDGVDRVDTDEVTWTRAGGIDAGGVDEISRLMDSAESFEAADHIRFHLGDSVEMLEHGSGAVTFAYAVVDLDMGEDEYDTGDDADNTIGWALLASHTAAP